MTDRAELHTKEALSGENAFDERAFENSVAIVANSCHQRIAADGAADGLTRPSTIRARNLVRQFVDVTAVDNISFGVKEGGAFASLRPNGVVMTTIRNR